MALVKEYYQITARKPNDVSRAWKIIHVLIFIGIVVCGFQATFTFGRAFAGFNFNCILYANLTFKDIDDNSTELAVLARRKLSKIDYKHSTWGDPLTCNFVQFMPLISMICGIVWVAFYIILSRGGKGDPGDIYLNPWMIIAPTLIFSALMIIPEVVCLGQALGGYQKFCSNFKDIFGKEGCTEDIDIYTTQFQEGKEYHFFRYIQIALLSKRFGLYLWIGQLVTVAIRIICFSDFQINKITIYGRHDMAESVRFLQGRDDV